MKALEIIVIWMLIATSALGGYYSARFELERTCHKYGAVELGGVILRCKSLPNP